MWCSSILVYVWCLDMFLPTRVKIDPHGGLWTMSWCLQQGYDTHEPCRQSFRQSHMPTLIYRLVQPALIVADSSQQAAHANGCALRRSSQSVGTWEGWVNRFLLMPRCACALLLRRHRCTPEEPHPLPGASCAPKCCYRHPIFVCLCMRSSSSLERTTCCIPKERHGHCSWEMWCPKMLLPASNICVFMYVWYMDMFLPTQIKIDPWASTRWLFHYVFLNHVSISIPPTLQERSFK
jgi:hypothetical protein